MNKEEYYNLLNSDEWKQKRNKILKRDYYKCKHCGSKSNLQVHHTHYIKGNMPWDVPDNYLKTLCGICHSKEHKGKNISSFILKRTNPKSKTIIIRKKCKLTGQPIFRKKKILK